MIGARATLTLAFSVLLSAPAICEEPPLLPDAPEGVTTLLADPPAPENLYGEMEELGLSARLMNFYVATVSDLSETGLDIGKVVNIPVQISEKEGGRQSIYYLDKGQRELVGVFIGGDQQILLHYVTRLSGLSKPAEEGDKYSFELENLKNQIIFEDTGLIVLIDHKTGAAKVKYSSGIEMNSLLWSIIGKTGQ